MAIVWLISTLRVAALRQQIQRHERIKMKLRLAGSSLAQVARELQVQPTTVTSVSRGLSRSKRIESRIAEVLRTTPDKLWPDRYEATG